MPVLGPVSYFHMNQYAPGGASLFGRWIHPKMCLLMEISMQNMGDIFLRGLMCVKNLNLGPYGWAYY